MLCVCIKKSVLCSLIGSSFQMSILSTFFRWIKEWKPLFALFFYSWLSAGTPWALAKHVVLLLTTLFFCCLPVIFLIRWSWKFTIVIDLLLLAVGYGSHGLNGMEWDLLKTPFTNKNLLSVDVYQYEDLLIWYLCFDALVGLKALFLCRWGLGSIR